MSFISKKRDVWYFWVYFDKKLHGISLRTKDYEEAQEKAKELAKKYPQEMEIVERSFIQRLSVYYGYILETYGHIFWQYPNECHYIGYVYGLYLLPQKAGAF